MVIIGINFCLYIYVIFYRKTTYQHQGQVYEQGYCPVCGLYLKGQVFVLNIHVIFYQKQMSTSGPGTQGALPSKYPVWGPYLTELNYVY